MKQKLLLLIVLGLAIFQGVAAEEVGEVGTTTENFEAYVGEQDTHTITLNYVTNLNLMDLANDSGQQPYGTTNSSKDDFIYILGNDSRMFSTTILDTTVSFVQGGLSVTVTMEVIYHPTTEGTHTATIYLDKQNQKSIALLELRGTSTITIGDVNGDGAVVIDDATMLIDHILGNEYENFIFINADVDGDGIITIGDLTRLIDYILGSPITRPFTFLLIGLTDGTTHEIMIDDNSTVRIAKPDLIIKSQGQIMNYSLEQIVQLRYEERIITLCNKAVSEYVNPSFSTILNTSQP